MFRRTQMLLVTLFVWSLASAATAQLGGLLDQAKSLGGDSLTQLIGQQVGADSSQIEGGLGSLLSLAQSQFSSGDFAKLSGAVPGVDKYMDAARSLGVLDSPITSMDGVNAALGKLGMSSETISKFVPTAVNALGQLGGADVAKLLSSLTGA